MVSATYCCDTAQTWNGVAHDMNCPQFADVDWDKFDKEAGLADDDVMDGPALMVDADYYSQCDLCQYEHALVWYMWDVADIKTSGPPPPGQYVITCPPCHMDLLEEFDKMQPSAATAPPGSKPPTHVTTAWSKKCNDPHFTRLPGPKGFGYLRLSSERGGLYVDTKADYGLFFSVGWERLAEPDVKVWTPGKKPAVPMLLQEDIEDWPSCAFVYWQDMGAPNIGVMRYLDWAYDQWSNGKNIQFGCFGAHGRTGTFAALLYLKAGLAKDGEDAMRIIRAEHCVDAIESKAQENFILQYAKEM